MQTNTSLVKWRLESYYQEKKIPIWFFDQNLDVAFTNFSTAAILNLFECVRPLARNFLLAHSIEGYHLNLDNPYVMYFEFSYATGKHNAYTMIIGPVLTINPTEKVWPELNFSGNLFAEQKRILSRALPVMDVEDFKLEITNFLKQVIEVAPPTFETESISAVIEKYSQDTNEFDNDAVDADKIDISDIAEICRLEDLFQVYVSNGNTYQLYSMFKDEHASEVLFPNKASVQACKVRAAELLTLARIASHESGNDSVSCYSRFQKFSAKLINAKSYENISRIVERCAIEYARNTHDMNKYTSDSYSPMTNKCIQRIIERLPDKISLDELAKELHISAKYLSALFNKETGSSITDFMQDLRVSEAKHLLSNTELSYLEISTLLNFSSQSYFNCIFKKKTGVTPKEYREQALQKSAISN
ncbi:AraC family transcriptional regulator [Butyrivibrio sp. AE3004]|uniref:AraC family transcriptional regulator n=1 Tax=Butyrivibrio sp. AE3004 TaxID=1506994 RepID=UPI000494B1BB|nr:AraC family transcriptional regulator [Butyrivibrio sp. AE3004]